MIALTLSIVAGIVIACLLFKPFFPEEDDFMETLGHALTPDIISLFTGRWGEDFVASLKLNVWLLMSGAGGYIVCLAVTAMINKLS